MIDTYRETDSIPVKYIPGPIENIKANIKNGYFNWLAIPGIICLAATLAIHGYVWLLPAIVCAILIPYIIYSFVVTFVITITNPPGEEYREYSSDRFYYLSEKYKTMFYYIMTA